MQLCNILQLGCQSVIYRKWLRGHCALVILCFGDLELLSIRKDLLMQFKNRLELCLCPWHPGELTTLPL